jgi:hypothetical protein
MMQPLATVMTPAQVEQPAEPSPALFPIGQNSHVCSPSASWYVLAGHFSQDKAVASTLEKRPTWQSSQLVAAVAAGAYFPAGHEEHEMMKLGVSSVFEYVPDAHSSHSI